MKNPFTRIRVFWGEMMTELKKAAWPTWSELKESTIVVIIGIIIMGLYVSVVDFSLFQVVNLFTDLVRGKIGL